MGDWLERRRVSREWQSDQAPSRASSSYGCSYHLSVRVSHELSFKFNALRFSIWIIAAARSVQVDSPHDITVIRGRRERPWLSVVRATAARPLVWQQTFVFKYRRCSIAHPHLDVTTFLVTVVQDELTHSCPRGRVACHSVMAILGPSKIDPVQAAHNVRDSRSQRDCKDRRAYRFLNENHSLGRCESPIRKQAWATKRD